MPAAGMFLEGRGQPQRGRTMPKRTQAMMKVMTMLNAWAVRKDQRRARFSREMMSLRRVSSPTQTKARLKKRELKALATPGSMSLPLASGVKAPFIWQMLKTREAATKPMMNFGNFSQTMWREGAVPDFCPRVER